MLLKKLIFIILAILIVIETGYLTSLLRQLQTLQTSLAEKSVDQSPIPPSMPKPSPRSTPDEGSLPLQEMQRIRDCEKILETHPDDWNTRWTLIQLYLKYPSKKKSALPHIHKILELQPHHPRKAFLQKAAATLETIPENKTKPLSQNQIESQLVKKLEADLVGTPDNADTRWSLIRLYMKYPEEKERALFHLQEIMRLHPGHPQKALFEQWTKSLAANN